MSHFSFCSTLFGHLIDVWGLGRRVRTGEMDAEGGDGTVAGGRARGRGGGGTGEAKEGEMLRQRMPTPHCPWLLHPGSLFPVCRFLISSLQLPAQASPSLISRICLIFYFLSRHLSSLSLFPPLCLFVSALFISWFLMCVSL